MSDEFEGEASLLENEESVEDSGNDEVRGPNADCYCHGYHHNNETAKQMASVTDP